MTNEGTYTEVEEPRRLAFGETVVTFTDLGDGRTEMTFRTTTEASGELLGPHEGRRGERVRAPRRPPQGDHVSTTTKIVTGVDYVGIPTNDIEAARAFYDRRARAGAPRACGSGPARSRGRRGVRDRHGHDRADQLPGPGHPVPGQPGAARAAGRGRRGGARGARVTRGRRSPPTTSTAASATWPTSRTRTATRSCCITATRRAARPRPASAVRERTHGRGERALHRRRRRRRGGLLPRPARFRGRRCSRHRGSRCSPAAGSACS